MIHLCQFNSDVNVPCAGTVTTGVATNDRPPPTPLHAQSLAPSIWHLPPTDCAAEAVIIIVLIPNLVPLPGSVVLFVLLVMS